MWTLCLLVLLGLWECQCQAPPEPVLTQVTFPLEHSEGPHWDAGKNCLYYVDIAGETVNRLDPQARTLHSLQLEGGGVTLVLPVKGSANELIVTRGRDLLLVTWDGVSPRPESVKILASVEHEHPGNRFNDGKADGLGRVWAGTMGPEPKVGEVTPFQGAFYSLEAGSSHALKHLTNVTVSNGLAWSKDSKTLYYIDSPTRRVDAFDFNLKDGTISNRRAVFDFAANNVTGVPDGMTIDSDENLWVACFDGGKVIHVDPRSGTLLQAVHMPVSRVTSVSFGGANLQTLYITTSRLGLTKEEEGAGAVFALEGLGVSGLRLDHQPIVKHEQENHH